MLKKILAVVVAAGLLLGNIHAKSLRDVLGSSLDQMSEGDTTLNLDNKGVTEIKEEEVQTM